MGTALAAGMSYCVIIPVDSVSLCVIAVIGGAGLLGGVLLGEALESHDDDDRDMGYQDGM